MSEILSNIKFLSFLNKGVYTDMEELCAENSMVAIVKTYEK